MSRQVVHNEDVTTKNSTWADTRKYLLDEPNESVQGRAAALPNIYPPAGLLAWCCILGRNGHKNVKTFGVAIRARLAASASNVRLARAAVDCLKENATFVQIDDVAATNVLDSIRVR